MSVRNARRVLPVLSLALVAGATLAADKTRIHNEGGIREEWALADGVALAAPAYPAEFQGRGDNVCVAIAYAIKPDGTTSDFALLRQWSSAGEQEPAKGYFDAFASAAAAALSQWRFQPRPGIARPQRTVTVATMHFTGRQPMDLSDLRGHCRITDLAAVIRDARRDSDHDRLRRDMESHRRAAESSGSMVSNPGAAQGKPLSTRP